MILQEAVIGLIEVAQGAGVVRTMELNNELRCTLLIPKP